MTPSEEHDCFVELFGDLREGHIGVLAWDGKRYSAIRAPRAAIADEEHRGEYMRHLTRGLNIDDDQG